MPDIDPADVAEAIREDDRADRDTEVADELKSTEKIIDELTKDGEGTSSST